ncbi:hypothetical protein D3C86_1247360 [compost metagenome]
MPPTVTETGPEVAVAGTWIDRLVASAVVGVAVTVPPPSFWKVTVLLAGVGLKPAPTMVMVSPVTVLLGETRVIWRPAAPLAPMTTKLTRLLSLERVVTLRFPVLAPWGTSTMSSLGLAM